MTIAQSIMHTKSPSFARVFHADGPDPDREAKLALFSWLVGNWNFDIIIDP